MKTHTISEIQKELKTLDKQEILQYCVRLAKHKKENKELLSYLLFEAHNETAYIREVKNDMAVFFAEINTSSVYYIKKSLRKILRHLNRSAKYSGHKSTEIELRIYFCNMIKEQGLPIHDSLSLGNIYQKEVGKIKKVFSQLHEDLQFDYKDDVEVL